MKKPLFTGVATALVTPMKNGEIDFPAYDALLRQQAGIPALVVTGTTGEAATLSTAEKKSLWTYTAQKSEACVIAGIGTNDTRTSAENACLAQQCGVDGLLAVTPYYNKGTQAGLCAHFFAIAGSTSLPLIVYNVPSRTGVNLLPETCAKLAEHENIIGVKEASGDLVQAAKIRRLCPDDFYLWSGNDDQIVPMLSLGGIGVISVLSGIRPEGVKRMVQAALDGDFRLAAALQLHYLPLIEALFSEVNPIPIKAALAAEGYCTDEVRLPLTPMRAEKRGQLLQALSIS